ncbi:MAG: phosphoadenylyl-sulfate reductase [Nitrosopumilus sp.]|nr:phosphoadenylyl-sulfate reductase [Nitrosopumilus sp.]CAI9832552.1 Thioredoxin-dependent 5'-adenylylsulfate reductase [Nitrosopumilaceae archaeon]MDA7941043.1 phosphoadenylyl-sulfate reductase [Nitrosopumilus sp.]MDA7942559.1 phosphoadenylyl-sulfate reductase [Nitrosopumilus sp.]MDA7944480.1 phosphoadenylyl-sulfate reductase [Nitrosopumilus sp.]
MAGFTQGDVDRLNSEITGAEGALRWASENLHPRVAKASSFGAEDAAIMHMMVSINPDFRFFTLDTGRLPQETYDAIDAARRRYNARIEVLFPDSGDVEEMVRERGVNLFYDSVENRQLCCEIRKVRPTSRMLAGLDGWITGLRRDQTPDRSGARMFELDGPRIKINPIIDWTWEMVWEYIRSRDLPYNALLDRGYPSIGCAPCTRPVSPGEDRRAGRWWWEQDGRKECGLHVGGIR